MSCRYCLFNDLLTGHNNGHSLLYYLMEQSNMYNCEKDILKCKKVGST